MLGSSMSAVGRVWRSGRGDLKLYLLSIFSLAVAFVCLASALLVLVNLRAVEARWARAGRISVYLRDGLPDEQLAALRRALEQTPGIASTRYMSSADARRDMVDDGVSGSLAVLPVEAFPSSIELSLENDATEERVAALVQKLRELPSVESVETYQRWTERVSALVRGGVMASAVLALVVLAAVISVIGSTMRLALHRRRVEVEVLKLVGATDRFVRGPFLVEGAAQGALGALASLALLGVLYLIVRGKFDDDLGLLLGVHPTFLPWEFVVGMVAAGATLGAASAFAGVRRLAAV
ncbi:MAG TPA: permease-like cell division protein FtsX [Polyangiaceae bacterium]